MPNSDTSRFWIAAEVILALALVALPASLGGAPEWTSWLLLGLAAAALGVWLVGASRNHRRWGWHPVLWAPLVLTVVALVQLVPLPPGVLRALSPQAAELREFALVPLGLEGWRPLSMDAPATARGLARVISLGALLFVALELGRLPGVRKRLFMVLGLSGALTAALGFVHLLAGLDSLFGVHAFYGNVPLISFFGNTNHLAAWLLLAGTVAAGVAMRADTRDQAIGWGAVALVCGVGVFFSFSRGGIASFVATWALVGAAVLARRGGGLKSVMPWVLIGGTVLVAGFLSFEQLVERAETLSSLDKFKATKIELWPMFARGLEPFWALGAGLGAFELAFGPAQTTEFTITFTHPEMIGLQWVADVGLPLAVLALVFSGWLFLRLWRLAAKSAMERTALLGLLGLVMHDLFDFALELNAVAAAAAIVLGLLCSMDEGGPRLAVRTRGLVAGVVPVSVAVVALAWGTPGHLVAERRLGAAITEGQGYEQVRALAVRLIDRHPADWVLYAHVAQLAARKADPRESLAWINRVLALRPADARSHVAAAQALLRLGRPLQALGELKLAWARGESASLDLGLAIAAKERAWDRALLPTRGHLERAYWRLRTTGKVAEAKALLDAAVASPPSEEVAEEAAWLGVRHEAELGDAAKALAALDQLPQGVQRRSDLVITRVQALGKLGRADEAVTELDRLLTREPSNVAVGFMLVELLASRGRPAAAREVLQRVRPFAVAAGQRSATFLKEAGLWVQEERYPRALDALQTASRIEPTRADLHYRLAEVYERMGSLHSALDEVRRGRLLDSPEGAKAQDPWVARLEAAMGQLP
jgi:tetratricopeptide (TPR) repeat protein